MDDREKQLKALTAHFPADLSKYIQIKINIE